MFRLYHLCCIKINEIKIGLHNCVISKLKKENLGLGTTDNQKIKEMVKEYHGKASVMLYDDKTKTRCHIMVKYRFTLFLCD